MNSTTTSSTISMCVVAVEVKWQDRCYQTHAILDNCSQGTFIALLHEMKIVRPKTKVRLGTLIGAKEINITAVKGLKVKSLESTI